MDFFALIGAAAGSLCLGFLKAFTAALDGRDMAKALQPAVVLGFAYAAAYAAQAFGISAADALPPIESAPAATVVAVTAREILRRAKPREP